MRVLLVVAIAVTCLTSHAAAQQIPLRCFNQCSVNWGSCSNVTQC